MSHQIRSHTEFSNELWSEIKGRLASSLKSYDGPRIAAFDADGTLWDLDIGENFFDYQIHHCNLKTLPPDPWHYYNTTKSVDPRRAYLWLAQISSGQLISDVEQWAEEAVQKLEFLPIFESQKKLFELLRSLHFKIYVVTASVEWAVVPAAARMGIPKDNVLGIKTLIRDGRVSTEQDGCITWKEGKAEALLSHTGGIPPLFCAGNTTGDSALLKIATDCALALRSKTNIGTDLGKTEAGLLEIARAQGWLSHEF